MKKKPDTGSTERAFEEPFTELFVDAIEDGQARLLLDEEAFTVPVRLLPRGARAGVWIRLTGSVVPAPPSRADAIRKKLARDDDGGPIKL